MIVDYVLDAGKCLDAFSQKNQEAGAVVSFSGQVRAEGKTETVLSLFLQAYEPLTRENIKDKVLEAKTRWSLDDLQILHRIGEIPVGDTIVFVAAASKHRREAFEAVDFLMDYLKTEAIFWKKEITMNDSKWIEPREKDYLDAKRWI